MFAATKNRGVRKLFDESEAVVKLSIEQALAAQCDGAKHLSLRALLRRIDEFDDVTIELV